MKNDSNKKLMFAISNSLSEPEAISFAKTLDRETQYYLVCVHRNPTAKHVAKRAKFVVVRDIKNNEIVSNGNALFVEKNGLCSVPN